MDPSLPSPPSSHPNSPDRLMSDTLAPQPDLRGVDADTQVGDSLSERLDQLLASYLELLDVYTTLRAELSQNLSSGYLSLAQANRNSTLGPGRRYGEEGYDERMKASRMVKIDRATSLGQGSRPISEEEARSMKSKDDKNNTSQRGAQSENGQSLDQDSSRNRHQSTLSAKEHGADEVKQEPARLIQESNDDRSTTGKNGRASTSPSNPIQVTSHLSSDRTPPASTSTSTSPSCSTYRYDVTSTPLASSSLKESQPKDPLNWYGILVPATLRTSQTQFQTCVTSTIPALLTAESGLKGLEAEIWDLRQDLGILDDYDYNHREGDDDNKEVYVREGEEDKQSPVEGKRERERENTSTGKSLKDNRLDPGSLPALSSLSLSTSPKRADQSRSKSSLDKTPSVLASASTAQGLPSDARSRVLKLD